MQTLGRSTPLVTLVVFVLLLSLSACSGTKPVEAEKRTGPPPAVPVTVGTAVQKAVPLQITAIGNAQAYSTVQVKSMVAGELLQVHFQEGQYVNKGDLLFTIDPRPFQAALQQAEANLARDRAQAANAKADAQRYAYLVKNGIVPAEQYEQFKTNAEALQATVKADEAAVENAKVQLSYTKIYSPVEGRTGNLLIYQGNIIKANDVPIVVINQIRPIYVSFAVPGQDLPEIKRYMARRPLSVTVTPKEGGAAATGTLTFIDNAIDVNTGTVLLKATFPNEDKALWPGEFFDVSLTLTTQNVVVVPSQAVQTGQQGQYVFVVKPDLTVETRPVTMSRQVGTEAVISQGISPGEKVVTDGQLRLVPGGKIRVVGQAGDQTAGSPAPGQ